MLHSDSVTRGTPVKGKSSNYSVFTPKKPYVETYTRELPIALWNFAESVLFAVGNFLHL